MTPFTSVTAGMSVTKMLFGCYIRYIRYIRYGRT